jgi:hypothetical protein
MIGYCSGGGSELFGLEESGFIYDVLYLLALVIPAAVCYLLWRIFVTNRRGSRATTVLGLDENSETYPEPYDQGASWLKLFLYGLAGVVFVVEAFNTW